MAAGGAHKPIAGLRISIFFRVEVHVSCSLAVWMSRETCLIVLVGRSSRSDRDRPREKAAAPAAASTAATTRHDQCRASP